MKEALPDFSQFRSVNLKTETMAGFIGALITIPQGITFAYLAGVPPQHGLACAVVITFLAAFFGNSTMVSGPNSSTSIVVGASIFPLAPHGTAIFVEYVMLLTLMVGLIQLIIWLSRVAKIFDYLTPASTSGLSMGVGGLIMLAALDGILQLSSMESPLFYQKLYVIFMGWDKLINPFSTAIGAVTILAGWWSAKSHPRHYVFASLFAGIIASLLVKALWPQSQMTIDFLGALSLGLGQMHIPRLNSESLSVALTLIPAALATAVISLSQSLVIAKNLKRTEDKDINLNKEVFAIGLSNTVAPLFSAMAGSGSFNRTQVNQEMGAKTPFAALLSAAGVAFFVVFLGEQLRHLPLAVIAGILFLVGYRMIKWKEIKSFTSSPFVALNFFAVVFAVLFLGLNAAVALAAILSLVAALKKL